MTRYSVHSKVFVKSYGVLSFAKNMGKNIDKNISKNLSSKYGQKLLGHAKKSATDALKTFSKRFIQNTGETIGNKIANRPTKVSKNSQQNISETVTNEHDKEIPKERYVSPEERQNIIDNLIFNIIV